MDRLSDVVIFVRVVECGSLSAASDAMGVSRGVISKALARLEARLETRLLQRTTRRLSLTEAGAAFFEKSREGLALVDAAEHAVTSLRDEARGTLRVSAPASFAVTLLAPLLGAFQARYPAVQIDLDMNDRYADLVAGRIDVAIRIGMLEDSSLVARRLASCAHAIYGAPSYFRQRGIPQTPDDLREHNCLVYANYDGPYDWVLADPTGQRHIAHVSGSMLANNSLVLREAARSGLGISLGPAYLVREDIEAGRLQAVLTNYTAREVPLHAVFTQRVHLLPKVRAFVDFLGEHLTRTGVMGPLPTLTA
ncbi:LysR family transcriptional regulator [Ralstonia sp. ASV6]|uniref:LysR family transcriptional regulator n=1 Tax=Ralstonia sp. ASV6 TaxID=2795124 RepID=UPI0018ECF3C2|nr:LysR family transcriptional regulator [Ralstonia sp. ASV6]